ncbi:hypothetical protein ABT168_26390 [Streptomyces sp. NPDC001793]|uniref:hypothetical protein n=1 Tax=Streptomyces sp. NPDC001793 TaxID=3154657 RepID=UPI003320560A
MSQLADEVEDELIDAAEELLEDRPVPNAVLCEALRDVVRIAVSRGARLPEPCDHGEIDKNTDGKTRCTSCRRQLYL